MSGKEYTFTSPTLIALMSRTGKDIEAMHYSDLSACFPAPVPSRTTSTHPTADYGSLLDFWRDFCMEMALVRMLGHRSNMYGRFVQPEGNLVIEKIETPDTQAITGRRGALLRIGAAGIMGFALPAASTAATQAATTDAPSPAATDDAAIGTVWWAELVSDDLDRASAFYSSVIGWTVAKVAMNDSARAPQKDEPAYLMFKSGGGEVAGGLLTSPDAPGKTKPTWIVYFQVEDVDAAVGRSLAKGGTLLIHPFTVAGSARLAVVADPDGAPFGLASPV